MKVFKFMKSLMLLKGRKGMEHPRAIIYTIFVVILLIFNIVMMVGFLDNVEIFSTYRLHNLRHNNLAARVIYTTDCFASSETYIYDGVQGSYVKPGVLNINRITKSRFRDCVQPSRMDYDVSVRIIDGKEILKGCNKDWERKSRYLVLIDSGGVLEEGVVTVCSNYKGE